jgi:hypothetical protein
MDFSDKVIVNVIGNEEGIRVYLNNCAIVKGLKLSKIRELFKPIMDRTSNYTNLN